jgi:SAM-dependent methyltransferase
MRNVIYLSGITSTGKTTTATALSQKMGVPFCSVDAVNHAVANEVGFDDPKRFVFPEYWRDYPTYELKVKHYRKALEGFKGDFILEGFDLGFEEDRRAVREAIGEHWMTFFYLDPSFSDWCDFTFRKTGCLPSWNVYAHYRRYFEPPEHYYPVSLPGSIVVDRQAYQKEGFTDEKFRRLKLNPEGKAILDLGCNDGWIGRYCLDAGAKRVVGIDHNWRYLEEARKKGVETRLLKLDELHLLNGRFDMVLCLATLQHLDNPEKAVLEMARLAEMLVLEIPVWKGQKEKGWLKREGYTYSFPSEPLVLGWLEKAFGRVERVGESVSPDDSFRLIFKAYNG